MSFKDTSKDVEEATGIVMAHMRTLSARTDLNEDEERLSNALGTLLSRVGAVEDSRLKALVAIIVGKKGLERMTDHEAKLLEALVSGKE